jgi:pimeloyl-ACP methyl ester carboxylesterase
LRIVDEGVGRPVVLLHGFPDRAELWRDVSPHLQAGGLRTLAVDLPGFGESPAPRGRDAYDIEKNVAAHVLLRRARGRVATRTALAGRLPMRSLALDKRSRRRCCRVPGRQLDRGGVGQAPRRVRRDPGADPAPAAGRQVDRRAVLEVIGYDRLDQAVLERTGLHLEEQSPLTCVPAITVPTLVGQVHDDVMTTACGRSGAAVSGNARYPGRLLAHCAGPASDPRSPEAQGYDQR